MESPDSPSVPVSEPEAERQVLEMVFDEFERNGFLRVVPIFKVRDFLREFGLDVDGDGFVIDLGSGERVEPFAFDRDLFRERELGEGESPFDVFYRVESECDWVIGSKGEVHLKDLHTVWEFDGVARPVRDDGVNLRDAFAHLEVGFTSVCEWSDSLELAKKVDVKAMYDRRRDSEFEALCLGCLECGFEGVVDEWDVDYSEYLERAGEDEDVDFVLESVNLELGELRCPECSCLWDEFTLEWCVECESVHRWEDVTPDGGGGMYWEPSCPDCGVGQSSLLGKSRYSVSDGWGGES